MKLQNPKQQLLEKLKSYEQTCLDPEATKQSRKFHSTLSNGDKEFCIITRNIINILSDGKTSTSDMMINKFQNRIPENMLLKVLR